MEIKPHSLRAFCAVVETQSLQAASQLVGLSPSAISRIVGQIEQGLGVVLFERSDRRMRPTSPGLELHRKVRELLVLWDHVAQFGRAHPKAVEVVRVAVLSRHAETLVAPAMAHAMSDIGSNIQYKLDLHAQRDFGFSRLARPFDIGFGHLVGDHEGLEKERIGDSALVVVLPRKHALEGKAAIEPADLAGFPIVSLVRDTIINAHVLQNLGPLNPLNIAVEVSHTHVALRMVEEGAGLHITDEWAAARAQGRGCSVVPLRPASAVPIFAFWPKATGKDRMAIATLIERVQALLQDKVR